MKVSEADIQITVLMAVHNGERHLREALDSILSQSFRGFEFLVVDDGSTDRTAGILADYQVRDQRIRLVRNAGKLGLARSLNKGIALARGKYIARMDADDVSDAGRLERQLAYLETNPEACGVAVKVRIIDGAGGAAGFWDDDLATTTFAEIVRLLPERNCLAHPGIMLRSEVLRAFRYHEGMEHSQDYQLWMRLIASGLRIEKLDEVLLSYRVTPSSTTSVSNRGNYWRKLLSPKWHYLCWAVANRRLGLFTIRVGWSFLKTLLGHHLATAIRPAQPR